MTAHPTRHIRWRTTKKERPPLILLTQLTQLLQIQHLPQRHTPQRQNILMQIVALRCRPALKRGRIAPNGRKVAVVQPIFHGFLLLHAHPLCFAAVSLTGSAEGEAFRLLGRAFVVVLDPAAADEEDVADLDVATLRRGTDVNALVLAYCDEVVVADRVGCCAVVLDALAVGVAPVVEEDAPAREAMIRPVMDAALVVRSRSDDVLLMRIVVESLRWDVCEVAESVPLCAGLGVHVVCVVVADSVKDSEDLVFELLAVEGWLCWDVEWEIQAGHFSGLDF